MVRMGTQICSLLKKQQAEWRRFQKGVVHKLCHLGKGVKGQPPRPYLIIGGGGQNLPILRQYRLWMTPKGMPVYQALYEYVCHPKKLMSRSTVGKCSFIRAFIINVNAVHFKLKLFNYTDDWKPKYLKNYVTMHF